MKYCYDFAFGDLVFAKDSSFKCPVCGGQTANQRKLKHGQKIVCSECKSVFKKDIWPSNDGKPYHGARFVEHGPQFHACIVMEIPARQNRGKK